MGILVSVWGSLRETGVPVRRARSCLDGPPVNHFTDPTGERRSCGAELRESLKRRTHLIFKRRYNRAITAAQKH